MNTIAKLKAKVKRALLNFDDDEKQIRNARQKTKEALERLKNISKTRNTK